MKMTIRVILPIAAALMLTGCVSGGGLMKQASSSLLSLTLENRERECVNDFRLQGYERVPD